MRIYWLFIVLIFFCSCAEEDVVEIPKGCEEHPTAEDLIVKSNAIVILGTVQDAGSPQIGCTKDCCKDLYDNPQVNRKVVSLGLIDTENQKQYLFEATPDMMSQCNWLKRYAGSDKEVPDGIFLTHAHIGHYTGLMHLGKEAMNANQVPVYAMPKMKIFLEQNGPWSQLVTNNNIVLNELDQQKPTVLPNSFHILPLVVPHRDEYSETVGYLITGKNKKALFIPDIDKWDKWDKDIIEEISKVDYAFLDATFYDGEELNNRDMSEIPHPFIVESMEKFKDLPAKEKSKIYFIHFNHTNPVINKDSKQYKTVISNGFNIAQINDVFPL